MIVYNNRSSDEFGITITKGVTFDSPSRDLETVKVPGMDGSIKMGDGTLNNVQKSFPFVLKGNKRDVAQVATEISNWLKSDKNWHWLSFSGDEEYFYQAIATEEYNIERVVSWFGKGTLDFEIKPYKFLKTGFQTFNLGETLYNPLNRHSRPKLTIKGNGNITIKIGAEQLDLLSVNGGLIVDVLDEVVMDLNGNAAWNKVGSYPLITVASGLNEVEVIGNVESVQIMPRWETIV